MDVMIAARGLSRRFGPIVAVDDVSFDVGRGEVLGFLGPNGAGKSTTMKMITGFLAPTSGTAVVCGADIGTDPVAAKRHLGYLPEGAPAYPDMTPRSFMRFIAAIRGFGGAEAKKRIDLAVERLALQNVLEQPIDTLSKGFKRRVGLAQALLHDPEVLILDEPTDGLDPNQKHEVRALINALAPDKAIVISTHLLEEVDAVCTRAIVIASGKILADATPLDLAGDIRDAALSLQRLPGVASVEETDDTDGTALLVFPRAGQPILGEVTDLVRAAGWPIRALRVERGRLDDVFRSITGG